MASKPGCSPASKSAAADGASKGAGVLARSLMKFRQGSTKMQTATMAGVIVVACVALAFALAGSPASPPPERRTCNHASTAPHLGYRRYKGLNSLQWPTSQ